MCRRLEKMMQNTHQGPPDLVDRFKYHVPSTQKARDDLTEVRERCYALATEIVRLVPDGREQSAALTNLEQVMFWANAGIARRSSVLSADHP